MTAAPKFTPGPWKAEHRGRARKWIIWDANVHAVAVVETDCPADHANARLIAAAPKLYQALSDVVAHFDATNNVTAMATYARAALAKVTP